MFKASLAVVMVNHIISNRGESNPDGIGGGSLSYFVARKGLMINSVNIKIYI